MPFASWTDDQGHSRIDFCPDGALGSHHGSTRPQAGRRVLAAGHVSGWILRTPRRERQVSQCAVTCSTTSRMARVAHRVLRSCGRRAPRLG